ncbi:MAG: rhodanese-like domain-containing protein [Pseudomonadota bacterium]
MEKVLVTADFFETDHGQIGCEKCHGGNPADKTKDGAHKDFDAHPSINNPQGACGECHEDIVATAKDSLHATLSTFTTVLKERSDMNKWHEIDQARAGHCAACHTSCGGCHVSRPKFAKKGFVAGHKFQKRTDPFNQCTACHGSRVGNEYYGSRGQGDVHITKLNMDCVACHTATEMHAAAPAGLKGRYHLKEMVNCEDCHQGLENGSVREHNLHIGKVQCQVCHSQTYVNCYSCHTGKDEEGVRYFQNQKEIEGMKIGLNYDKDEPNQTAKYILVRHEPSDLEVFDFYVKDAFTNFDKVPTWKRTSPHNIQRNTWQTANCNNCHGNRELFLDKKDLLDYEVKANASVVVPDNKVPKKRDKVMPLNIDTSKVRTSMVVDAKWLHDNMSKGVKIVDARGDAEYEKGHIEGAVILDPLGSGLRHSFDEDKPMELVADAELVKIIGGKGLKSDDHIVVYDKDGTKAGFIIWVLEYAGATNVSYLNGGIEGWHEAGYHTSTEEAEPKAADFGGKINSALTVGNDYINANMYKGNVAIVDARGIAQAKGLSKHGQAERAGRIPESINLPLSALYMDNGALKKPEELLWMLKKNGITPDKTVVTTCNTGQLAGSAYFMFRYLGYDNVKVHDASWISYCAVD